MHRACVMRVQQLAQSGRHVSRRKFVRPEERSHAELADAAGVVGLVVRERHDELGDAGRQRLGSGADAAVMDDRRAARKSLAEWQVIEMPHGRRKIRRQLRGIARGENCAASHGQGGAERRLEEPASMRHRGARGEKHGRLAGGEEGFEFRIGRVLAREVFEREADALCGGGPVGLRGGEPFRKQAEHAVRRLPPIAKGVVRRRHALLATGALDAGRDGAVHSSVGQFEKRAFRPARNALQEPEAAPEIGRVVNAPVDARLEVHRDERESEFFPREPRAEAGGRRDEKGMAVFCLGANEVEISFRDVTRESQNERSAFGRMPDRGFFRESVIFRLRAHRNEAQARGRDVACKERIRDHGDVVAAFAEDAADPEEGIHVAGAANGQEQHAAGLAVSGGRH